MPGWLIALMGASLLGGIGQATGATKSKQETSSTTDPFYALMSPYVIGNMLNRFGALSNAGFPSGAMNTLGGMNLGNDIWKVIAQQWPQIKSGMKVK